jgi:hypothetical protein
LWIIERPDGIVVDPVQMTGGIVRQSISSGEIEGERIHHDHE